MEEHLDGHLSTLETNPGEPDALAAVESFYTDSGEWEPLAKVFEENAQRIADAVRTPELYLRAAEVYRDKLQLPDKAERCLRRLLDTDPSNRAGQNLLVTVLEEAERYTDLAVLLQQIVDGAIDDQEKAHNLEALGRLYDDKLDQPEDALVALQAAFEADRTAKSALLKGAAIYQRMGRHEMAKGLLDVLLDVAQDEADAKLLADRYVDVADELLLCPSHHKAAQDAVARTLALVPAHDRAKEISGELEKYTEEWEVHVRSLRAAAMDARDKNTAASRHLSIAEHYWVYGKDFETAEQSLEKAFLLVPGFWPAVRFFEAMCRQADRSEHLRQRLTKMAGEITDVRVAVDLYMLIAVLETEAGQDREHIVEIYTKVIGIDPANKNAIMALTDLYLESDQVELAAQVQSRFARETRDPEERKSAYLLAARMQLKESGNRDEAIANYQAVREIDGDNVEAIEALDGLYQQVGKHAERASLLERRIELTSGSGDKIALLDTLASVYSDDLEDPLLAFEAMRQAYVLQPQQLREEQLEHLADSLARPGELAQTYLDAVAQVEEPAERKRLQLRVAHLASEAGQPNLAREALGQVLNDDPNNDQALAALESLVVKGADARTLADALEARLAVARATKERRTLLLRLARLYAQELRESGKAIDRYRALLELDPNDTESLEALDGLLRREERWRELAQVLEKRIERETEPEVLELKLRLAKLFEERLDKAVEALDLYEMLHGAAPDRLDFVAALERLLVRGVEPHRVASVLQPHYAAVGAHRRHVEMIEIRRQGVEDPRLKAQLSREAARILSEELRSPREAFTAMSDALLNDPADPEIPRELDTLAEAAGAHDDFAAALDLAASSLPESPAKVALEARRAAVLESRLGDSAAAIDAHRNLLRQNPGNLESLDALVGLLQRADKYEELVEWLDVRRQFSAPVEQPTIDERIGHVYVDKLSNSEAALVAFERARSTPDDAVRERILLRLDELYLERDDKAPLLSVLQERVELAVGTERAELSARIGELHYRMQDAPQAVQAFQQTLEGDSRNSRAINGLAELLEDQDVAIADRVQAALLLEPLRRAEDNAAGLAVVLQTRMLAVTESAERRTLVVELAKLLAEELDSIDQALDLLGQHLQADPEDGGALQLLEGLAVASGEVSRLFDTMLAIIGAGGEVAEEYATKLSTVATERGALEVARQGMSLLAQQQPENQAVYAELVELARQESDSVALGEALVNQAKVAEPDQAKVLLTEAAEVFAMADEEMRAVEALRFYISKLGYDLAVADQLAALLSSQERFEEVGGMWHELLSQVEPEHQWDVALRLGVVQLGSLESPDGAVKHFALCLAEGAPEETAKRAVSMLDNIARGDQQARFAARLALADYYRRSDGVRPLIEILERAAEESDQAEEKAEFLDEVAQLRDTRLEETTLAFAAASRAFRAVANVERLHVLRELSQRADSDEVYVVLLEEVADSLAQTDSATAAMLLHEAATVWSERLQDRASRIRLLQRVLEIQPGDAEALRGLEEVHRDAAETEQLVAVLRQKAATTEVSEERFGAQLQVAKLLCNEGRMEEGVAALREIDEEHAERQEVLDLLETAYSRSGDYDSLAQLLQQQIEPETDAAVRGVLSTKLGRAYLAQAMLDEALESLRAAAQDTPRDPTLAAALGELLERSKAAESPQPVVVAEILETVLRAVGSTEDLPPVLELRIQASSDPVQRQELLLEVSHIQETMLGQPALAFMKACQALREAPGEAEALERLDRVARRSHSEEEFVDVLEEIIEGVEEADTLATLHSRIAELLEGTHERDKAMQHLERAHTYAPKDSIIAEALVRVGSGRSTSPALASACTLVASSSAVGGDIDRAKELWLEAAELYDELEDLDAARTALESIRELDGRDLQALRLLDRLYERLGQDQALAQILEQEIEVSDSPQLRGELLLRLCELKRSKLSDPLGAAEAVERVALEMPGTVGLVAALECVAADLAGMASPEAAAIRANIAGLLAPRYEASGEVGKLVEILEARLEGVSDVEERRGLLLRVSKLRSESMGQPEQAFRALSRALKESPDDSSLRTNAEQAAAETGDLETLVALFEEIAEGGVAVDVALDYRRRVAALCRGPLGDPGRALQHYEQVLELLGSPEEDQVERRQIRLQVVDSMEEVTRALEAWGQLATALKRRAQLDTEADRRREAVLELITLQLGPLADSGAALGLARSLLDIDAEDSAALDVAITACEQQGLYPELVAFLKQRIEITTEPEERLNYRFRLGRALDEGLEQSEAAMAVFSSVLEEAPNHTQTRAYLEGRLEYSKSSRNVSVEALEGAYAKTGDWQKAIEVLEAQVQDAEKRSDAVASRSLIQRIAEIHTKHLDSPELAFATLTRALKAERGEEELREHLHQLAAELETLDDLAEAYEAEAEMAQDKGRPEITAELLEAAASIYAFDLEEVEKGLQLFQQILEKQPGRIATLGCLDRIYQQQGRHQELEEVLRKRLAMSEDKEERASLLFRQGLCLADYLDRPDDAIPVLEKVLELDPVHSGARKTLSELYVDTGQDTKLRSVLESLLADAQGAEDQDEITRLRTLLARLLGERIEDYEEAIRHWETIAKVDPSNLEPPSALEELYRKAERFEDLRDLLESRLSVVSDSHQQAELSAKLGVVLADHLGDPETAIAKFERVLDGDQRNRDALESLRRIYRSIGRHEDLVAVLRRLLSLQTDAAGVKAIRFELAEVLGGPLNRRSDAIEAGRRVLDVEPHSEEELQRLEAIFRACEAWEECAETLDRRVDLAEGPETQIPILYEIAALWEGPIGRPEAAARAYERILAVHPADEVAYKALNEIYAGSDEWRKLVALKEARLGSLEWKAERLQLLKEIGETYEIRLAQKDLAFLAACRAFREDVLDKECGAWMERLAIETDSAEELLDVYEDEVQRVGDETRAIEIHLRMAELSANQLEDTATAEEHLSKVFEYDAENRDALDQLFALYQNLDRFEDAVGVLERKIEVAEDLETKKSLLFRICQTFEEYLQQPASAVEGYKRVLELDSADRRAVNNLARLYEELEKPQALIGILQRAIEVEEDESEQLAIRYRVAGIWETELENPEQAIATHRTILEIDPAHYLSLKALERIYTQLDRMSELLGVYEKQVALADSTDEQVRLLSKISNIWEERFDNVEQSVAATERILLIAPSNEVAIKSLARLFRQTANWTRLIDVMRQHIELTKDPEEIVTLYLDIGEVFYKELNRVDKAEEAYTAALDFDPRSRRAIHALGQLYERSGNWFNALEKLAQEVELLGAEAEAVDIHFRMGKINEDMLLDSGSARASYEKALDLEPGFLPAIKALKEIHYNARDYDSYLKYLTQEAEHMDDALEKTELYTTAAKFLQDRSGDLDGAVQYYTEALKFTHDHLEAAMPCADIEFRRENHERARELLEIIVDSLDPTTETMEVVRHQYRLGYVNQKLENEAEALRAFQKAFELDSTYLPALEGYGQALVQAQRFEEAQKVYQTLLIHHQQDLTDAEVVDYYWQLGDVSRQLDQNERALRNLEKALELDPSHAPSLMLTGEILEAEGQHEDAYDSYDQLAGLLSGDEKLELLLHIGRLSQQQLEDSYRAIDAYEEANKVRRGQKEVLEALFDLYRETAQGPRAAEILEELVGVEPDEQARVRLNYTLGELYRDELKNDARSVQYFNAALDLDPNYVRAFEAIEKLLTARRQWQALEENYRAMVQRTPKENVKVRVVLWQNLAELYRRVLKQPEAAVQAYNVLCRLDPGNPRYMETLAELMSRMPNRVAEAIGTYQSLIPVSQEPARACHALRRLYLSRQLYDRAFCVVSALRLLRDTDDEENKLYAHYAKHAPQKATRALTERLWDALLVHPQAQGNLAMASTILQRHAGRELLEDPKALGLGKKREWERVDAGRYFVNQLKYVHNVLNTGPFEFFQKKKSDSVLTLLPTPIPTLGIGEHNDMFKEVPPRHIWFATARILTYMRPAYMVPFLLGPGDFGAALEAALIFVEPRFQGRSHPEDIARMGRRLQKVREPLSEALKPVLKKILAERKRPDVPAFMEGIELTAIRAAHLMCGDIDTTVKMLRVKDPGQMQLQFRAKMKELLQFITSEPYFELRARLALAIKGQTA